MRNLILSVLGLVIVIVAIFLITSKNNDNGDIFIPDQKEESSPKLNLNNLNESSKSVMGNKTYQSPPSPLPENEIKGKKVRIKTVKGDIVIELFESAPSASSNFLFLTREKFYDGLTFHRREEGFVIQGGDPIGNGTGGPGYKFNDEPITLNYERGTVAMANAGPNTNGSQFFIMLADAPSLPKNYTIFGKVISGIEVVDLIKVGDIMTSVSVEN